MSQPARAPRSASMGTRAPGRAAADYGIVPHGLAAILLAAPARSAHAASSCRGQRSGRAAAAESGYRRAARGRGCAAADRGQLCGGGSDEPRRPRRPTLGAVGTGQEGGAPRRASRSGELGPARVQRRSAGCVPARVLELPDDAGHRRRAGRGRRRPARGSGHHRRHGDVDGHPQQRHRTGACPAGKEQGRRARVGDGRVAAREPPGGRIGRAPTGTVSPHREPTTSSSRWCTGS